METENILRERLANLAHTVKTSCNALDTLMAEIEGQLSNLETKEQRGNFKPENGEKYYLSHGNSDYHARMWSPDGVDKRNYNLGICCRTPKEAILLAKKNHALRQIQDAIDEMEGERDIAIYYQLKDKKIYRSYRFNPSSEKVFLTAATNNFNLLDFKEQAEEIGNYYNYINFLD